MAAPQSRWLLFRAPVEIMLKARIVTGVVLALSFLFVLLNPNTLYFYGFCGVALLLAAWEWSALCSMRANASRGLYVAIVALGFVAYLFWANSANLAEQASWERSVLLLTIPIWLASLFAVLCFPRIQTIWNQSWLKVLLGLIIFAQAWVGLIYLREHSYATAWIVFVIALVAFSDIGAYFAGRRFGRHKLAINVSPGKTWEGFFGGLMAASLLGLLVLQLFAGSLFARASVFEVVIVIALVSSLSAIGDLSLSMLKRVAGVKDSGAILPGHGGVLDRIDGMLSALPVFAFIVLLLDW